MIKTEEKNYLNEIAKNNKNEKYKPKQTEVASSKNRVKQLLQLKEEAIQKEDFDKLKIIEAELFQMRS